MEDVFVLPASSTQQRLWFLDRYSKAGAAYNVFAAFTLRGPLRPDLLQRSLNAVAARHESLRTAFTVSEGTLSQVVQTTVQIPLEIVAWPAGLDDPGLAERLSREAATTFSLSAAPLVRAILFAIEPETHVFFLVSHHIILDGWGQRLLLEETAAVYNALAAGREPALPALALQYGDFAIWEQQALKEGAYDAGLAFWKEHLAGELPVLDLPRDHARPPEPTYRGRTLPFTLKADVSQRLHELARRERASLFVVVLSALATLLHRYTGQTDVLIGSPIANRLRAEVEATIGFFANTVVFRSDLSGRPTFRELLGRVRQTANGVYAHQDVPFDYVVNAVQPERRTQNPMFQVMLAAQVLPDAMLAFDGIDVQPRVVDNGSAKFDLLVELQERPSGTDVRLEYSTDLFEPATAERMRSHLVTLLDSIAESADVRIDEYALMSADERRLVVETFNATAVDYPAEALLHEMIEAQVARTPRAIALECEGQTLTFEALDCQANQLAHHLREAGVDRNQVVAICLERSLDLIVALCATLKAGGAYVPLDPDYPIERLRFMVHDANAPVLITTAALSERLGLQAPRVLLIDREAEEWRKRPAAKPDVAIAPDDLAYMIYTSGSTGRPKGARNAHRGICNRLAWMRDEYGVDERAVIVQKTPVSFDVSVWELFLPLLTGARMVLARPGGHRDPAYLLELFETSGVTMAHFVPSMLRVFLDQNDLQRASRLRHVICSGEALPVDLRETFFRSYRCGLHNLYGPTEAAVDVTYWDARQPCDTPTVPIGRPVANTQIYILDALGSPTPLGVPGELFIGGIQVGAGYHNRPELTAERFVDDPFSATPGARLYRTGDLCRYLPDGAIEFLGRLDHQVKLRGFRVELGEIESTLKSHESVREVVLTSLDDPQHGQRLVAYVVARQDGEETSHTDALRTEHVNEWEGVWDQIYRQRTTPDDPTFNIIGWNNSYSRTPFPDEEMREWVAQTVTRITSLEPRRVWEIGCGTGLLLFRLAPLCETYLGTDHSVTVLQSLAPYVASMPQVHLQRSPAHEAPADSLPYRQGQFDTVILNSVAQYFPSADYLLSVIDTGIAALRDGGAFYLGDIRNLVQLEAFHTSIQLFQAPDDLPVTSLRERVQRAIAQEQELVLHPEFFTSLPRRNPRVTSVEILVKNGRSDNELTRFRYDVILRVGGAPDAEPSQWTTAPASVDERSIEQWVADVQASGETGSVRMRDVPNRRVLVHQRAVELMESSDAPSTVGELKRALARRPFQGVDPERVWSATAAIPRVLEISPSASGRPETVDLTVRMPVGESAGQDAVAAATGAANRKPLDASYWRQRANNPLQASYARRLMPQLRAYLTARLPDYMVPSAFVFLERIPLSPNGKVDRRALPPPDAPLNRTMLLPPRDDIEERMVAIWSEVLGVRNISRTDNFFDLGGHSLIAAKLLTQMNKAFNTRLQLPVLFETSTIEGVARVIRGGDLAPRGKCVVALSPAGSAPPLFFVHPLGGGVTEYLPLAKYLSPDQPLFGLHVPLEDGVPAWTDTIESMARRYAEEIVQQCPAGPILLGGWSGGAAVALEIAQQLRARRREVPLVIALDASPYNTHSETPKSSPLYAWKLLRNFPHWLRDDAMAHGSADLWARLKRKVHAFRERGRANNAESGFSAEVGGFFDLSRVSDEHRRFMERYFVALRRYVPKHYAGPVLLVKARTQPLYHLLEPELAWPTLTRELDVHVLPCTHLSIVRDPHVRDVAALIKAKVAPLTAGPAPDGSAAVSLTTAGGHIVRTDASAVRP
jgi:amino acid adenylation domain-containing protein